MRKSRRTSLFSLPAAGAVFSGIGCGFVKNTCRIQVDPDSAFATIIGLPLVAVSALEKELSSKMGDCPVPQSPYSVFEKPLSFFILESMEKMRGGRRSTKNSLP